MTGTIRPSGMSTAQPMLMRAVVLMWLASATVMRMAGWFSRAWATDLMSMAV